MKTYFFLTLLCYTIVFLPAGEAQNGTLSMGSGQAMAMGYTGSAYIGVHNIWRNQAGLADIQDLTFITMGEQRFLLAQIRSIAAGIAMPTPSGTFALSLDYFGLDAFNQQQVGLAYGRKLLDKLSIGGRFLYMHTRIPDYGQHGYFTFEMGLMATVLPHIQIGAHLHNPLHLEVTENEVLPTIFSLGIAWQPSEKLLISGEIEKDIDFPASLKTGIHYSIVEALSLQIGMGSNPKLVTFGMGYQFENHLSIHIASSFHQFLGLTPGIDITYSISKE